MMALGAALGPSGLAVLTGRLLELIDPVIPVALASVGVLAGLEPGLLTQAGRRRPAVMAIYDVVVAAAVAGATFLLARVLQVEVATAWMVAGITGVCALAARSSNAIIPILIGGLALAWLRDGYPLAAWIVANAAAVAVACAAIGWLLLYRPSPDTEARVVTVAMLLLIGGAADYLAVSALLGGLVAGLCWRLAGGATRESVRRDVSFLRHPLLAVLLLTAGARIELTAVALALGVGYAVLGAVAARLSAAQISTIVSGSNVLAVALAVAALRAAGPDVALALAVVVIGTMLSQVLAMSLGRTEAIE
jgi:hypothetical protein